MTTFLDLRTAVIEDSHRADLSALVPRFVREAEGMIRRDMTAYLLTATLTDSEREAAGEPIYSLPARTVTIRRVAPEGQQRGLNRIALDAVGAYALTDRVHSYAQIDDKRIELRGNPADGSSFVLDYFGLPAPLVADADTNELLTDHETLYKSATLFYLYQHTQDRELASDQLDVFNGVLDPLNERIGRIIGGTQVTQGYNFNGGSSY